MTTALPVIDVQQALCSGEHATFDAAGDAGARSAGAIHGLKFLF